MLNIKNETGAFIRDVMIDHSPEYIFAIQRKGIASLKLVESLEKDIGIRIYYLNNFVFLNTEKIKNKRIIIYDDACFTGKGLFNMANKFQGNECSIKTASLVINKYAKHIPDYYRFILAPNEFRRLLTLSFDESFGDELYDDHIKYKIYSRKGNEYDFVKKLKEYGAVYELNHCKERKVRIVVLNNWDYYKVYEEYNWLLKDEGVRKIRLFIHDDGRINIVPRYYPAINKESIIKVCATRKGISLCNLFTGIRCNEKSELSISCCAKLINLEVNCRILGHFMIILRRILKECGYSILDEELNESDLKAVFFIDDNIVNTIKKILRSAEA